jgi:protoglobin
MNDEILFRRYQELQSYVGWTEEDARRVQAVAELLEPYLSKLIEDFYAEIDRHQGPARSSPAGRSRSSV